MYSEQPLYEIERAHRAEKTKSAVAGLVMGGLLTAGVVLLLKPFPAEHGPADDRCQHARIARRPGSDYRAAATSRESDPAVRERRMRARQLQRERS
jgi:hypothetical protein